MDDPSNRRILVRQPRPPHFKAESPSSPASVVVPMSGPPGPQGPAGMSSYDTTRWWTGEGPPPDAIVGAKPGDFYLDSLTGDYYQLQ